MTTQSSSTGGGIGFSGALFLTFLVLKLTHVINWSWWWIAAPLWIPAAIAFLLVAVVLAVGVAKDR